MKSQQRNGVLDPEADFDRVESPTGVVAGLVPVTSTVEAKNNRGGRDKPRHDPRERPVLQRDWNLRQKLRPHSPVRRIVGEGERLLEPDSVGGCIGVAGKHRPLDLIEPLFMIKHRH